MLKVNLLQTRNQNVIKSRIEGKEEKDKMEWIAPLITGISSIVVAIITVVVKSNIDKKTAEKKHVTDDTICESELGEMIYIQEYIEAIREEYKFDRVTICQFHNGGKFFNGRSMKKFSMTYEACSLGIEKIKRQYQNMMVSEFPKLFGAMFEKEIIIIYKDSTEYPIAARDMAINGIVQNVVIPIKGLRDDLLGFIQCQNIGESDDKITYDLTHTLADKANQISGYLAK